MRLFLIFSLSILTLSVFVIQFVGPVDLQSGQPQTNVSTVRAPEIFASGVVEGRDREVELRFELVGRILAVEVAEGALVKKGDVIARLDPTTLRHELAQAEANLELALAKKELLVNGAGSEARAVALAEVDVARVRASQTRSTYERSLLLATTKAISQQEFDDNEATMRKSAAEVQLARCKAMEISAAARPDEIRIAEARISLEAARVNQAEALLEKTELTAPFDGMVLQVQAELGEIVGAESEEPIVKFVDFSETRVRAFVEELDAVRITRGIAAQVSADGLAGVQFRGQVVSCSPLMVPKRNFANRPGERVDVKVREVVVTLDEQPMLDHLVVGLPVDVYLQAGGAQ